MTPQQSTALQTVVPTSGGALAQPISYNEQQLLLIKDQYANGASNEEFQLFVEQSRYRGLDIFKGQICLIGFKKRGADKKTYQPCVKIDGYRSLAERTGLYEGQTMPEWCGEDGVWKDVWLSKVAPAAARVGVYRVGFREAVYGVATYESYVQTWDGKATGQWASMPDVMLAKCAEALALRKGFPEQLGGLYTEDEMMQAQSTSTGGERQTGRQQQQQQTSEQTKQRSTVKASNAAEESLNSMLLEWCTKDKKGVKANGVAWFNHLFTGKDFDFKQKFALDKGLVIAAADDVITVEAEDVTDAQPELGDAADSQTSTQGDKLSI
jgi:phage recombination protein Bet